MKQYKKLWLIVTVIFSVLVTSAAPQSTAEAVNLNDYIDLDDVGTASATETPAETAAPSETAAPAVEYSFSEVSLYRYSASCAVLRWESYGTHTGFYVYRKASFDSSYKKLGSVENQAYAAIKYRDTTFKKGITYAYKVVAYNKDSSGETSTGTSKTLRGVKVSLGSTDVSAVKRSGTEVTVRWKKKAGADGYEVYKKTGSSYKLVKRVSGFGTVKWTAKNIPYNKRVKFRVRPYVKYSGHYAYGSYGKAKSVYTLSQQKVANKIKKLQKQYKDGRYWNHAGKSSYSSSTTTSTPCVHSYNNVSSTCNYYMCPNGVLGFQCYGFAWKMSDLVYGRSAKIRNFKSFQKCRMGDVIRYSGHSVFVVEKHSNYVVVGECNYGNTCIIKWGRKVYKSELSGATYSSRY
ncbi:MAG: hypothetical protein LUH14_10135 [Clostridiaceae bacterium]|nr:hypothetical protein [Clostridiaceae bacterium]